MGEPKSAAGPGLLSLGNPAAECLAVPVGDSDHSSGPADAAVTLLEYGDYECFYCGAAENILRVVQERLAAPVRFVFRHFRCQSRHVSLSAAWLLSHRSSLY